MSNIFSEPKIETWYDKFKRKVMIIKIITKNDTDRNCSKNVTCAHLILMTKA